MIAGFLIVLAGFWALGALLALCAVVVGARHDTHQDPA